MRRQPVNRTILWTELHCREMIPVDTYVAHRIAVGVQRTCGSIITIIFTLQTYTHRPST